MAKNRESCLIIPELDSIFRAQLLISYNGEYRKGSNDLEE